MVRARVAISKLLKNNIMHLISNFKTVEFQQFLFLHSDLVIIVKLLLLFGILRII